MASPLLWRRRTKRLDACFALLFEQAPEPMALIAADGTLRETNPALRDLAGPALSLKRGTPATGLLAPAARPALAAALAAVAAGQLPEPLLTAPADPRASPETRWKLLLRPAGDAVLLQACDITAEQRTTAALAAAERLALVGRLAGGIAHDFNNLLATVVGSAAAAREVAPDPAVLRELAQIEDAAGRGAGLVRQLLAFARQQRLQPQSLALNEAVAGLAPLLGRLLGARIRLELALEAPGRRIRVDPSQLDQVILNLAVNAGQAMPEGGVLRLATGHALVLRDGEGPPGLAPGRYAVLEVSDTGAGIPPEVLPRIFEPFYTSRPDQGGTGLGLATVQGIVAQSGGHIAVSAAPGGGTVFRIHLPRDEGAAPVLLAPAIVAPAAGPILLVEDEAPLRRLAEAVLRRAGHAVLAADCGEAALELLADAPPPALLVTDVAMPGMDGLALARHLRAERPGLPVVLLSGYAESVLGCDLAAERLGFLAKPHAPTALLAAVAAAGLKA